MKSERGARQLEENSVGIPIPAGDQEALHRAELLANALPDICSFDPEVEIPGSALWVEVSDLGSAEERDDFFRMHRWVLTGHLRARG